MSNILQLIQNGTLKKEFPKIKAGAHVFAISTFEFTKQKNKLGVIGDIARANLVVLESSCHKPGERLNIEFWYGFPDRDFVGQQDQKVSEMLTFVKNVLGLETLEETQKEMANLYASSQASRTGESPALFGLRVACKGADQIGKKSGKPYVAYSWEHVEGQTPEAQKAQADELATYLGIALPSEAPAPAAAGGSLLGGLKK